MVEFSQLYTEEDYNNSYKTSNIKVGDKNIAVFNKRPIESKINIVQLALQESMENGIYNEGKLQTLFYVYTVFYYTDIEFTDEEKADYYKVFNVLFNSGLLEKIFAKIDVDEMKILTELLDSQKTTNEKYLLSAAGIVNSFINEVPAAMAEVGNMINNFNPENYQAVIDFATAANGGRSIFTNEEVSN